MQYRSAIWRKSPPLCDQGWRTAATLTSTKAPNGNSATATQLRAGMRLLLDAGLIIPKKIKQWTFYRRDDTVITDIAERLADAAA